MTPSIKINMDQVVANFKKSIDLANNFKPLLQVILGDQESNKPWTIRGSVFVSFKNMKSPDSLEQWEPLSSKYAQWKEKKYPGKPMLVRTGELFNSLVRSSSGTVGPFYPTSKSMSFGTSIPYAAYHQSVSGRKTLPRRAFLGMYPGQLRTWNLLLKQYMKDAVSGVDPMAKLRGAK